MEEVDTAMRAAAAFVERAVDEPRIQTVLDELRKLAIDSNNRDTSMDEKITHIKHQATSIGSSASTASYASVLGRQSTASSTTGGAPISLSMNMPPAMPKQGQTPYNKHNEIVIKLQDETASEALEGKTPVEMTAMVNGFIKSMDTMRKPVARQGDLEAVISTSWRRTRRRHTLYEKASSG